MADLYNLLADDNLLRSEDGYEEDVADDQELNDNQVQSGQEWDQVEREQIEWSAPDLVEPLVSPTHLTPKSIPDLNDERPLELQDLQQEEQNELQLLYNKLKMLWTQELLSPELLPFDDETMTSLIDILSDRDELSSEDGLGIYASGNSNLDSLIASIVRVDSSRCKFVLCHLLRERLHKLETYPWYHHTQPSQADRMSANERDFLRQYVELLEGHLHKTVLDHFPQEAWKQLDAPEMIDEPDLNSYVFVRTKKLVTIATNTSADGGIRDDGTDRTEVQQHDEGTCLIVRYSHVRELFLQDKVELLM